MRIDAHERRVLQELARETRDIAQHDGWNDKIRLWKDKNSLKRTRPLILCSPPEAAWREIIPEASLTTRDPFFRNYEVDLRRRIYRWKRLHDDDVITDSIHVPIEYDLTDWFDNRKRPYSGQPDRSAAFSPCILEYGDLKKLKTPRLSVDWKRTNAAFEEVQDVFGDLLRVILGAPFHAGTDAAIMGWGTSLMDVLCELRGLENVFLDLYRAPDFVHEAMDLLMRGTLRYLSQLEREGILRLNNEETLLGSNGLAYTDELPGERHESGRVTTRNLWGYAQTQEFSEVSPRMLEEFVLPYQGRIMERFGMNCYGCCEPNDGKWELIVKHIPNLRSLSVSHSANIEIAARALKGEYVFSWKPHPARMIVNFDESYIRKEMGRVFDLTRECRLIACLRDTQTLSGEPDRLARWIELSMQAALEVA